MHRTPAAIIGATMALALPSANALAAMDKNVAVKPKVVVTTRSFTGATAQVDRWGEMQVVITVRKTTTTNPTTHKKTVKRRMTAVKVPVSPNHTDRSVFINQQALPLLIQEATTAQSAHINIVSGASDSSNGFAQSLQSALLKANAS
jgi:uncharacterized protein with FMN-binding domain